jgi:hypothetical protein
MVYSLFVLLLSLYCFISLLVLLLWCVSRSSLYCNIRSDLCSLCLSCYYFYIVLSLYLYCCYVVYPDDHFIVISVQTCVVCVCLVITSILFYLYTCTVVMLCIQIITFRSNNKKNTEYSSLKVYYSKVMVEIHNIATVQI